LADFSGVDPIRRIFRTGELSKHLALARELCLQPFILMAQRIVVLRQPRFVFLQLLDEVA
jgi:hypothetical protein